MDWIEEFKLNCKADAKLILIGNKLDLVQMDDSLRCVQKEEAERLAADHDFQYRETSAVTEKNVKEAFLKLMHDIYVEDTGINYPEKDGVALTTTNYSNRYLERQARDRGNKKDGNFFQKSCCSS